jgi:uncharacterized glyoxalase superfamily protein PhnB
MTTPTTPLAPYLVCRDAAAAIDFYVTAFGAQEQVRLPGPDGKIMHACVLVNGAPVMLVDENLDWGMRSPLSLGGTAVTLNLGVDDAVAWARRAVEAGAVERMPVSEQFWGDLYGVVEDPFGHQWALVTPTRAPMTADELQDAAAAAFASA